MSDSYLPDNEPRDILLSLEELAAKKLPHAPMFRKSADEITRLRSDLAAVTEERDRMREALKPFADAVDIFIAENHDAHLTIVTLGDFFHARAALEGVTEPAKGESNGK